jgi:hypothetical protein
MDAKVPVYHVITNVMHLLLVAAEVTEWMPRLGYSKFYGRKTGERR